MVLLLLINTLQCTVHLESNVIVVRHGFPIPISIGNLFYFTDFFVLLRGVSYYIRATSATAGTKQCKSRIYSTKEMVQLLANQLCGYNIKVIIKSYLNIFIGKDGHEGIILSQSKKFGSESSGSAGRKIGTSGTAIAQLNGTLKSSRERINFIKYSRVIEWYRQSTGECHLSNVSRGSCGRFVSEIRNALDRSGRKRSR